MEKHGGKLLVGLAAFFVGLIAFSFGYIVRDQDIHIVEEEEIICGVEETYHTYFEVLDLLVENHFSRPSREDLIKGSIDGMIESLDDPFTTYFDYEEAQDYFDKFGETYVGIGVRVRLEKDSIIIEEVFENAPADQAGIRVNDIITHVNGEDVQGYDFYEVIQRIVGEEGTVVIVGVSRRGVEETVFFEITRQTIDNPTIEYETFMSNGKKIGYIEVNTFGDETFQKFYDAIVDLESQNIEGLVVDLRDNGGGQLFTVFYMMQQFLVNDGNPIFSTEHYVNGVLQITNYESSTEIKKDYDVVTLVNENSASASEVFAAGMQEHGNYILVGTTTYGKGTMQNSPLLSSTLADRLHITIGKWFTPDHNWVHYEGGSDGITPDIIVEQTAIEQAYKVYLLDGNSIVYDTVNAKTANIQVILNALGYTVRIDGYFDMATMSAIEDIQTNYDLTVNGDINEETLDIINQLLDEYQGNSDNDTQLQTALDYLSND